MANYFTNMPQEKGNQTEDRTDEQLTPEKAYNLTEEQGYMGKVVADMYGVSQGYVSQLKGEYDNAIQKGKEKGKEEVEPSDFDVDTLENAIGDKREDSRFDAKAPCCGEPIPTPDSAGPEDCPECGTELNWSEDEI